MVSGVDGPGLADVHFFNTQFSRTYCVGSTSAGDVIAVYYGNGRAEMAHGVMLGVALEVTIEPRVRDHAASAILLLAPLRASVDALVRQTRYPTTDHHGVHCTDRTLLPRHLPAAGVQAIHSRQGANKGSDQNIYLGAYYVDASLTTFSVCLYTLQCLEWCLRLKLIVFGTARGHSHL